MTGTIPLSYLIENVDRSEANRSNGDLCDFEKAIFGDYHVGFNEEFYNDMLGYWICRHWCSDQDVGTIVWEYKGQLVAVSEQTSRKSPMTFKWASPEAYDTVKDVIAKMREPDYETPEFLDFAMPMAVYQKLHYREHLMVRSDHQYGYVWNQSHEHPAAIKAEVVDWHQYHGQPENPNYRSMYKEGTRVDIMVPRPYAHHQPFKREVEVDELRFPLKLKDGLGVELVEKSLSE